MELFYFHWTPYLAGSLSFAQAETREVLGEGGPARSVTIDDLDKPRGFTFLRTGRNPRGSWRGGMPSEKNEGAKDPSRSLAIRENLCILES
jgi:hypothetical protein